MTEQLKALAEAVVNNKIIGESWAHEANFQLYATPERILTLFAENERADKLLQQALEALEYRLQQTRPIHQADSVMEAIRTYLENKNA